MWLLKLHFSISVLCLITFIGFSIVCRQTLKDNGYVNDETKKKDISGYLAFFVPIMNIILILTMFIMLSVKKKDFDKMCEDAKNKSEASDNE